MARGILEVQLVDAKGLANTDFIGKIDPYVVIQYRNQERKSQVAKGSCMEKIKKAKKGDSLRVFIEGLGIVCGHVFWVQIFWVIVMVAKVLQGTKPTWNEVFKFLVNYSGADTQHKLTLRIMDKDTFTADDFIGQATINVADLISIGLEQGKGELHPCKHAVVLADQTYCGEIQVGVTFTPKVEEQGEDFGGWRNSFHS